MLRFAEMNRAQINKIKGKLERFGKSRWINLILLSVSCIDFFALFIPSDAFLVAAILIRPQHVIRFTSLMILGRLTAIVLAYQLVAFVTVAQLQTWAGSLGLESAWNQTHSFFQQFGALSTGITAVTPFPMLFPTFLSFASGSSLISVLLWSLLGVGIRYAILAFAVLTANKLISRV